MSHTTSAANVASLSLSDVQAVSLESSSYISQILAVEKANCYRRSLSWPSCCWYSQAGEPSRRTCSVTSASDPVSGSDAQSELAMS